MHGTNTSTCCPDHISTATSTMPLAAAPPMHVDNMACAPTPTLQERGSHMSITDATMGWSPRPTIIAELGTPQHAVQASVLSPMNLEQSVTGPPLSRAGPSTTISCQDRASGATWYQHAEACRSHINTCASWFDCHKPCTYVQGNECSCA